MITSVFDYSRIELTEILLTLVNGYIPEKVASFKKVISEAFQMV